MSESKNISISRLLLKTILALILVNFGWILIPKGVFSQISLYNHVIEGRKRLPFGENPALSYNLSTFDLDSMFASHEISKSGQINDHMKIVLIGDSSIWGFLQKPEEALSGLLNTEFAGKNIDFYNLGYPSISILKDLQIIDKVTQYDPDLILWFTTLEALPKSKQTEIPFNERNPENINALVSKYDLNNRYLIETDIIEKTFWERRRNIADLIRLQLYGFLWNATGIDQIYPEKFEPALRDFPEYSGDFYGISDNANLRDELEIGMISSVVEKYNNIDFILINEPILISEGENSHLQYNFYYPRWAYDKYRIILNTFMDENNIKYYDFWDLIPEKEFTNSAIHLSYEGEKIFSDEITKIINTYIGEKN